MGYSIDPVKNYSHKLDSEQVKAYIESEKDPFESKLLRYLVNNENKISKDFLTENLKKGNIKILFRFRNWDNAEFMQDITFAVATEKLCVIYNPFMGRRDVCKVFLSPYLRFFADCMKYEKTDEESYMAVLGAYERKRVSDTKRLFYTDGRIKYIYVNMDSLGVEAPKGSVKVNGNDVNEYLNSVMLRSFNDQDCFLDFKCRLRDILAGYDCKYGMQINDGFQKKKSFPQLDPRNYYEEELLDLIYGAFCYYIKESINPNRKIRDVSFCDKSELKIKVPLIAKKREGAVDSIPPFIERRAEGWLEFTREGYGKIRSKCIVKFKINGNYEIRKYEIVKMKYQSMDSKLRNDYYETGDCPFLEKIGCSIILIGLILFPVLFFINVRIVSLKLRLWILLRRILTTGRKEIRKMSMIFLNGRKNITKIIENKKETEI